MTLKDKPLPVFKIKSSDTVWSPVAFARDIFIVSSAHLPAARVPSEILHCEQEVNFDNIHQLAQGKSYVE